jgi:hypothetical protein
VSIDNVHPTVRGTRHGEFLRPSGGPSTGRFARVNARRNCSTDGPGSSGQKTARDCSVLFTLSAAITNDDAVVQNIPVISTINRASLSTLHRGRRTDRECFPKPIVRTFAAPVNLGVLNASSVANKTASISIWIADEKLTLAAVVETWHDGCDSPALIASKPAGYQ